MIFVLIDAAALVLGGSIAVMRARAQTRVEMAASIRLAEALVGDAVALARQQLPAEQFLADLPVQLRSIRHVRIAVKDEAGVPIRATPSADAPSGRGAAPRWFVELVAPPVDTRPARLVEKQRAGARIAVLNHVTSPQTVRQFMAAALSGGLTIPVLAAVAVFTDAVSAAVLQGLPGLELDDAVIRRVLDASDPIEAGIQAAVAEAQALLSIDGVVGVNLSGSASASGTQVGATIKAEVGTRIRTLQ